MRFGLFPLDDDYAAMRNTLWRTTDTIYKTALDQISHKRNALREVADPDKTPDLARATAVKVLEPSTRLNVDQRAWEQAVKRVSERFVSHPAVLTSNVRAQAIHSVYRMVNSEGTLLRMPEMLGEIQIRATARTADGQRVWNHSFQAAIGLDESPNLAELSKTADKIGTETEALAQAPLAEDYNGPVLFEQEAAAEMMAQVLTDAVMLHRKPIAPPNADAPGLDILESVWSSRVGSKVAPEWLSAFDDPLAETFQGSKLAGHYTVDDEGVPAQKVELIDRGTFKGFLMSRLPVRTFNDSNGHGRLEGPFGAEQPAIGNLFIQAAQPVTEIQLKAKLLEKVKAAGLKYGLLIRRMDFPSTSTLGDLQSLARQAQNSGYARTLNAPLLAYRVSLDGREELVRGLRFREFSAKDLRDVAAASDQPYVLNYLNNGSSVNIADLTTSAVTSSVICPSLLFDSIELARAQNEAGAAPVVPAHALALRQ
jgi:TldD protein